NAELVCGDFLDLDFGATFDVVYSSLTFLHIRDKAAAIRKVHSLLSDQGRFVVSLGKDRSTRLEYGDHCVQVYPDSVEEMAALLEKAGLRVESIVETDYAHLLTAVK
ncbi:MAG: methyltransferase domain-containing protein, partial [Chloroflexi bacterium]|nr:methyltransferase domain-containing protein [Chloroflexota bacterium]